MGSGDASGGSGAGGADWSFQNQTYFLLPACPQGWFIYGVYVLSVSFPGIGFRFLLDGMKAQRKYMWKYCGNVDALTSMLQGKRAQTKCLPEVRLDIPTDIVAWLECNELVRELYSLQPIRLIGDQATSYTMMMVIFLAGWLLYYAIQAEQQGESQGLKSHIVVLVILFFFIACTMLELVRVVWAGFNTNIALKKRVKQLNRTAQASMIMVSHARRLPVVVSSKVGNVREQVIDSKTEEGLGRWQHLKDCAQLAKDSYEYLRDANFRIKLMGILPLDIGGLLSMAAFFGSIMGKALSVPEVKKEIQDIYQTILAQLI